MAVPHGLVEKELVKNLKDLCKLSYIDYIGLSKTARKLKLRPMLAELAKELGKRVHFLGVWSTHS